MIALSGNDVWVVMEWVEVPDGLGCRYVRAVCPTYEKAVEISDHCRKNPRTNTTIQRCKVEDE